MSLILLTLIHPFLHGLNVPVGLQIDSVLVECNKIKMLFSTFVDLNDLQVASCLQAKAHWPPSSPRKPLRTFRSVAKHFRAGCNTWILQLPDFVISKHGGLLFVGRIKSIRSSGEEQV